MSLEGEGGGGDESGNPLSAANSRLSSTNLTQQKLQQQRIRQQQNNSGYHQRNNYSNQHNQHNVNNFFNSNIYQVSPNQQMQQLQSPPYPYQRTPSFGNISNMLIPTNTVVFPSAKEELSAFINESESRAIIVFHSCLVSPVVVRNACSKFGVLYYIRPEFHGRGVTLISYFDLRAAISCKASIAAEIGDDCQVSAHFSVMLHAGNSNSEEFRLVLSNLPPPPKDKEHSSEAEVQAIFSRYGQLRSIQKSFAASDLPPAASSTSTSSEDPCCTTSTSTSTSTSSCPYSVEYYNIQDARLAVSELSATSCSIWGPNTSVKFSPLDDRKQQLCRQLLATLSRWRTDMAMAPPSQLINPPPMPLQMHPLQYPQMMFMPHMGMSLMGGGGGGGSSNNLAAMNVMPIMNTPPPPSPPSTSTSMKNQDPPPFHLPQEASCSASNSSIASSDNTSLFDKHYINKHNNNNSHLLYLGNNGGGGNGGGGGYQQHLPLHLMDPHLPYQQQQQYHYPYPSQQYSPTNPPPPPHQQRFSPSPSNRSDSSQDHISFHSPPPTSHDGKR